MKIIMPSEYTKLSINLPINQWEWLKNMTSRYRLKGISKAIRICITCVAVGDAKAVAITSAAATQEREVELSSQQCRYIRGNFNSVSEALQQIIASCKMADEYTVFCVVRCKSSLVKCEGARNAILDIGELYNEADEDIVGSSKEDIII